MKMYEPPDGAEEDEDFTPPPPDVSHEDLEDEGLPLLSERDLPIAVDPEAD